MGITQQPPTDPRPGSDVRAGKTHHRLARCRRRFLMEPLKNRNVVVLPISGIKPNGSNAREHPEWQISQLARSIEASGVMQPILVDEDYVILAGHGRWL